MGGCASMHKHQQVHVLIEGSNMAPPPPASARRRGSNSRSRRGSGARAANSGGLVVQVKAASFAPSSTAAASGEGAVVPSVTLEVGMDSASSSSFSPGSPLVSPLSPSIAVAAVMPHPFGAAMSPAALLAFHPSASKGRDLKPLPRDVDNLWRQCILSAPRQFMQSASIRVEWAAIVAAEAMPERFRVAMWCAALGVDVNGGAAGAPPAGSGGRTYEQLLLLPSKCDDQIGRDIHRTFSTEPFFRHKEVQLALGRVLHAWSLCAPKVGYVQGHNYLAAMLLSTTAGDEELTWRMLLALLAYPDVEHGGLAALFADGLDLLIRQCRHLDALVAATLPPTLAEHLCAHHCDALMYATPVFLTLAAHHLPLEACKRVWDWVLLADNGWMDEDAAAAGSGGARAGAGEAHDAAPAAPAQAWGEANPSDAMAASGAMPLPAAGVAPARAASLSSSSPPPPPLSLHPSRWSHALTLLVLSSLSVSAKELQRQRSTDATFRVLQRLEVLTNDKTRKIVWKEAAKRAHAWRNDAATRNAIAAASQAHL